MNFLRLLIKIPGACYLLRILFERKHEPVQVAGLHFRNPVGLAAGFDKDGKYLKELECLGFGFVEVGTVTPLPQPGNEKPRLFRLTADQALLNRMGFNNEGVDVVSARLRTYSNRKMIVGGNIGKNKSTPNEKAIHDYLYCFQKLFDVVDYFAVNVSSPNTPGLRELQKQKPLLELLLAIEKLNQTKSKRKPVFLKISPDIQEIEIPELIAAVADSGIDGFIICNTTISRHGLKADPETIDKLGSGGISGLPLQKTSTKLIEQIHLLAPQMPLIASGGIMNGADVIQKRNSGAQLFQVYTGFIYSGPAIISRLLKALAS